MLSSENTQVLSSPVLHIHYCAFPLPCDGYGGALEQCIERRDGSFWAGNGEYGSQVNYCPYCGKKAPKQVE